MPPLSCAVKSPNPSCGSSAVRNPPDGVVLRIGVHEHSVILERLEVVSARCNESAAVPAGDEGAAGGRQGATSVLGQCAVEGDEPGRYGPDRKGRRPACVRKR